MNRIYERKNNEYNGKPAIYSLSLLARQILKNHKKCNIHALNKLYKEKTRSESFIVDCLFIANLYLQLRKLNQDKLKFFTKSQLEGYNYFPQPLPEAYIAIKEKKQEKEIIKRYFILLINQTIPMKYLKMKMQKYIDYSESTEWAENTNNARMPSFLIISPTKSKKKSLLNFMRKQYPQKNFFLTTRDDLKFIEEKNIWDKI